MTEERAIELASRNSKQVHDLLRKAFSQAEEQTGWIDGLITAENAAHQAFFGQTFDLGFFRQTLESCGEEQIRAWDKLKLKPHFLPGVVLTRESDFSGWKVKPNDWYWQQLVAGNLKRLAANGELKAVEQARLEGIVALIDTRFKPKYQDGRQMFASDRDFFGEIIVQLREKDQIQRYDSGPQSSRFGISAIEWQEHVRPKVAEKLGLETTQVRLELAIEANVIPQLYPSMPRAKDGTTDTYVWFEEFFESIAYRLHGGRSVCGGLAGVNWRYSDDRWSGRAVRPLVVLAS
jgi:hypothetical protein